MCEDLVLKTTFEVLLFMELQHRYEVDLRWKSKAAETPPLPPTSSLLLNTA